MSHVTRSEVFERIWRENVWGSPQSRSGAGSEIARTAELRRSLQALLEQLRPGLIYDAPCGDFNWMRLVGLPEGARYLGADIVRPMIDELQGLFGDDRRTFVVSDIVEQAPPAADIWICRESLFHLTLDEGLRVIEHWRRSDIPWFIATTTPTVVENHDIETGDWRPLNLQASPFSLGPTADWLPDRAPADPAKALGVWRRTSTG